MEKEAQLVIPEDMRLLPQWVLFRIIKSDKGKSKKIPYSANGKAANVNDPTTWCRFKEALAVLHDFDGLGFVFSKGDSFCGVDLDNVVTNGVIKPTVLEFLQKKLYSYTEFSPSRTGLHVIIKAQLPGDGKRGPLPKNFRCPDAKIEIYDQGRYFTMTGEHIELFPRVAQDRQKVADDVWHMLTTKTAKNLDSAPYKGTHADKSEEEIIAAFRQSGDKYSRLWDGDYSDYQSQSEADLAFVDRLIDLVGNNPERVKSIAFKSGLTRDKWNRDDYWNATYERANNKDRTRLLSYDTPDHTARVFIRSPQTPAIRYWREEFFQYSMGSYGKIGETTLKNTLWRWLATMRAWDQKAKAEGPYKVSSHKQNEAFRGIRAHSEIQCESPGWGYLPDVPPVDGRPDPEDLIVMKNGILQLSTGNLLPFTEDYFCVTPSPVSYNPENTHHPQWDAFLESVWGDDPDSIDALQRIFGYYLSNTIWDQKIAMLIGPTRAGKGIISHVIENILGKDNTCSISASHLADRFGMQVMIGKKVAIMPDVRIDRQSNAKTVEKLLNISGGDSQSIDRKYLGAWEGVLPVKFLMISNELPIMRDASGALANRFIILRMTESFLGREDRLLGRKLRGESEAIFNWAYEGYKKWESDGLTEPDSARQTKKDLQDLVSPLSPFIRECLIISPKSSCPRSKVYSTFKRWASINGAYIPSEAVFGKDIAALFPNVKTQRKRHEGQRVYCYVGLDLTNEWQ